MDYSNDVRLITQTHTPASVCSFSALQRDSELRRLYGRRYQADRRAHAHDDVNYQINKSKMVLFYCVSVLSFSSVFPW